MVNNHFTSWSLEFRNSAQLSRQRVLMWPAFNKISGLLSFRQVSLGRNTRYALRISRAEEARSVQDLFPLSLCDGRLWKSEVIPFRYYLMLLFPALC